jgi:hypothetical protein
MKRAGLVKGEGEYSFGYQVFQFETEERGPVKLTRSICWGISLVLVQSQARHLFLITILCEY